MTAMILIALKLSLRLGCGGIGAYGAVACWGNPG